jgi:hypothetical protein
LLRGLLSTFIQALMSAEASAQCGADYGERSPQRPIRERYRPRDFDTGADTTGVAHNLDNDCMEVWRMSRGGVVGSVEVEDLQVDW